MKSGKILLSTDHGRRSIYMLDLLPCYRHPWNLMEPIFRHIYNSTLFFYLTDSCKKVGIVFDDLVSSLEFVNCQSVQGQVRVIFLTSIFQILLCASMCPLCSVFALMGNIWTIFSYFIERTISEFNCGCKWTWKTIQF